MKTYYISFSGTQPVWLGIFPNKTEAVLFAASLKYENKNIIFQNSDKNFEIL